MWQKDGHIHNAIGLRAHKTIEQRPFCRITGDPKPQMDSISAVADDPSPLGAANV
jgi:hypothetical protein